MITSTEPRFSAQEQQDLATSEALKGAEAAAIKEQKKASEIMAERLPGLIDPNLPPDQQPLHDSSNPNPVAHSPQALHPDRFTPGAVANPAASPATAHRCAARRRLKPRSPSHMPVPRPARTASRPPSRKKPEQPKPPGGIHSHVCAGRKLSPRSGDSPLSASGVRAGAAGGAGAAGLAAARARATMPGSTCRWWSRSTLRWAGAAPSRAR